MRFRFLPVLVLCLLALSGVTRSAELPVGSGSYLGVKLTEIDADRAGALKLGETRGAEVAAVMRGGAADRAGIKPGDVLLTYNGEEVLSAQQLGRLVAETPEGRKVKLQYWRAGKMASTVVTTGAYPGPGSAPDAAAGFPTVLDFPVPMMLWKNSMLGVLYEPLDQQLGEFFGAKYGVLIRDVDPGSPAESAGMKAGDVITFLGNHMVSSPRDLVSYMRIQYQPGESITIVLLRAHHDVKLHVVLPAERQ